MIKLQKKLTHKTTSLYLVATENGICGVHSKKQNIPSFKNNKDLKKIEDHLLLAEKQLTDYFKGKRKSFNIPLDLHGTSFQKKVWAELLKIPYGKTRSYKEIAVDLKDSHASRAVGTANSKNPVWIIVPCHRVIASNGSLGGYAGGINMKKNLLTLEKGVPYANQK